MKWSWYENRNLTERGAIAYSVDGEVSWIQTECGNSWYMHKRYPFDANGCICPKCGKTIKLIVDDFVSGKPDKSGHYIIRNNNGELGTDDYTTSNGGMWWNNANDGSTLYSPSSYRGLGDY